MDKNWKKTVSWLELFAIANYYLPLHIQVKGTTARRTMQFVDYKCVFCTRCAKQMYSSHEKQMYK